MLYMMETGSDVGLKCGRLLGQGCEHVLHTTNMHWTSLIHVVHVEDRLQYGPQMWETPGPGMWTCTAHNKCALDFVNICCTCWRQALVWFSNVRGFRASNVDMYCIQAQHIVNSYTCWRQALVWASNVRGFRAGDVDMHCIR